jgi:hypothetical protein
MAGHRLTKDEIEVRVTTCYQKRFIDDKPMRYIDWIAYCHETYNDKSEEQYGRYWSQAGERYEEGWREQLRKLLKPATNELTRLLADEDPKIKQRAVDQIMKYTGNDIQKIDANISGDLEIKFGDE